MKRTEILCPNCLKKKVIHEKADKCYCDGCGQNYQLVGTNTLRFTN
jgi:hypothetical protein